MRLEEEQVEGDNEPTRIFPRRPLEWVLQIMGVFILFIALLINSSFDMSPSWSWSIVALKLQESVNSDFFWYVLEKVFPLRTTEVGLYVRRVNLTIRGAFKAHLWLKLRLYVEPLNDPIEPKNWPYLET